MKRLFCLSIALILSALLLVVMPLPSEASVYDECIRLHVLAASNDPREQADKLAVRDAILATWGSTLASATNREEAEAIARESLSQIRATAENILRARGSTHKVEVTLTEECYPTREYDGFTLPAGTYLSLRVLIGEAQGENWWCVLYPPLCLGTAIDGEIPLDEDAWGLMTENGGGKYTVRFRILEWLEALFS